MVSTGKKMQLVLLHRSAISVWTQSSNEEITPVFAFHFAARSLLGS
jgi:hypothetical protein